MPKTAAEIEAELSKMGTHMRTVREASAAARDARTLPESDPSPKTITVTKPIFPGGNNGKE